MSQITKAVRAFAPLAKGPIQKPNGMRNAVVDSIGKQALPAYIGLFGFFGVYYYFAFHRPMQKSIEYFKNVDADALYEEIKEYGVLKSARASWQSEDDEDN